MEEKFQRKLSWITLAVILVIAGIAAGFYFFYFNKKTATASFPLSAENSGSLDGAATLMSVMTKTSQAIDIQKPSASATIARTNPTATEKPDFTKGSQISTPGSAQSEKEPVILSVKTEKTPNPINAAKADQELSPINSSTSTPNITLTPTSESSPTPTLAMIPTEQDPGKDFTAWCLPKIGFVPEEWRNESLSMPAGGQVGKYEKGMTSLKFPFISCTFVYHLPQPISEGMEISIFDEISKLPWIRAKVNPSKNDTYIGYSRITHAYIIEPPFWKITYRFVLKDAGGNILREDKVILHKWEPEPCPDGSLPNPLTEYCPYIPQP